MKDQAARGLDRSAEQHGLFARRRAAGPLAAAAFMTVAGAQGLFLFIAFCAGGALLFGLWRQIRALPIPVEQQQTYQILPRTTPMSAALDPLAPVEPQEPQEAS